MLVADLTRYICLPLVERHMLDLKADTVIPARVQEHVDHVEY